MEIEAFILYKSTEFLPCQLIIKNGEIVEFSSHNFSKIFPQENRSALSKIEEIKKVHRPERIQNGCKYYIQHSINGEVMNIYLDIGRIKYWRLKWGFGKSIFQTNEFKIAFIIAFISAVLSAIFGLF